VTYAAGGSDYREGFERAAGFPPPDIIMTVVESDGNGNPGPNQEIIYATICESATRNDLSTS